VATSVEIWDQDRIATMTCICFVYPFLGFSGMHGSAVERFTPLRLLPLMQGTRMGPRRNGRDGQRPELRLSLGRWALTRRFYGPTCMVNRWKILGYFKAYRRQTLRRRRKSDRRRGKSGIHVVGGHLETCVCLTKQRSRPQNGKTVQKGLCDCGGSWV